MLSIPVLSFLFPLCITISIIFHYRFEDDTSDFHWVLPLYCIPDPCDDETGWTNRMAVKVLIYKGITKKCNFNIELLGQ